MCAPLVEPTEKETQFLNKSIMKNILFTHLRNISDEQDFISFSWVSSDFRIADFLTMTRNQINDTFLFQNRVKVKVVGEVSEK